MNDLKERMIAYDVEVKNTLQAVYDELNQGQRKKLLKNNIVRAMFERYNVKTT